jgi:hypothetical protein
MVEVPQREWVAYNLKPFDRFGQGDHYTDVTREIDMDGKVVTEIFTVVTPGDTQLFVLRYHLYTVDELSALLEKDGFGIVATYGDYKGSRLTLSSPVMVFVAKRNG